jgi:hypothetical protein
MVARAWGERTDARRSDRNARGTAGAGTESPRGVEEQFVQNDTVSLCLLVNRRLRTMRVIDFRAGPSEAKRLFVLELAKREGVTKVYTLVERDEVATWMKLGFVKEGNIPGFYKRSDAFMLGCSASAAIAPGAAVVPDEDEPPTPSPAHDRAEKTIVRAKKLAKDLADRSLPVTKVAALREADVKRAVDKALRSGRALTAFEPFGRDVVRSYFQITARSGFELVASTESQSCFGNAFLELLTAPETETERLATASALSALCEKLIADGVVSCFSIAPSDDVALATAFVFNGFRRTGLLVDHLVVGGKRRDATIWSRKLANPGGD